MRADITTAVTVRPYFVRPWSGWHFILARVQFTLRKVHVKYRKLGEAGLSCAKLILTKAWRCRLLFPRSLLKCDAVRSFLFARLSVFFAQRFYFLGNCVLERFDSLAGHRRDLIQLQLLFLAVFL